MNTEIKILKFYILLLFINFIFFSNVYAQNYLIMDNQTGYKGETVIFTISISNAPNEVSNLAIDIKYDPSVLKCTDSCKGDLLELFTFFNVNRNYADDIIRIGSFASSLAPSIPIGSSGELVKLTFTIKKTSDSELIFLCLYDDLIGWGTTNGHLTANCDDGALLENLAVGRNLIINPLPSCNPYTSFDLLEDAGELGSIVNVHCKNTPQSPYHSTYWFFGKISGDKIDHSFDASSETLYIIDKAE